MNYPNLNFEENISIPFIKIYQNNQNNNYLNLLNIKQTQETGHFFSHLNTKMLVLEIMQRIYIKNCLRYLNNEFNESIKDDFTNIMTLKMALFICFNLAIIMIYIILWLPLLEKIKKDVKFLNLSKTLFIIDFEDSVSINDYSDTNSKKT